MSANLEILIIICLSIFIFSAGIYTGSIFCSKSGAHSEEAPVSFLKKNKSAKSDMKTKISIDDTKVVTKIETSGMERKFDELGQKSTKQNTIKSSINKLKNMKGN